MKQSQYAKQHGISYKTVWRWYKAGHLDAYQTATGTVIMRDPSVAIPAGGRVAFYAQVSSVAQKEDLHRQVQRLRTYALARGYQVAKEVIEIASGLNDQRPKLTKLLQDSTIRVIVIEHRDCLTRFGFHSIETLLAVQDRRIEVIFPSDTQDDLVDDYVSVITSMAAKIYGRHQSKRRAEQVKACVEQIMKRDEDA